MSTRPKIPAEIERLILLESGHRCAVCGSPLPLERAHIIPWHKSKQHKAEDLICLCANCHERADKEKWSEKTLREYKRRPWILRQYENIGVLPEHKSKIQITIDIELKDFDERNKRWLQSAIAGFLEISPSAVQIISAEEGSVKVTIELPETDAKRLLNAYEKNDPRLAKYLAPLILLNVSILKELSEKNPKELLLDNGSMQGPSSTELHRHIEEVGQEEAFSRFRKVFEEASLELKEQKDREMMRVSQLYMFGLVSNALSILFILIATISLLLGSFTFAILGTAISLIFNVLKAFSSMREDTAHKRITLYFKQLNEVNQVSNLMALCETFELASERETFRKKIFNHIIDTGLSDYSFKATKMRKK